MVFITSNNCIIIFIAITACSSPGRYMAKQQDKEFGEDDGNYYYYRLCGSFQCGGINFSFPFSNSTMFGTGSRDCGLPRFQIICNADSPKIELGGRLYHVNGFFPDPAVRAITLVDTQLLTELSTGSCNSVLQNFTIETMSSPIASLSIPSWNFNNFTFLICPHTLSLSSQFLHAAVINRSCGDSADELYMFSNRTDLNRVETPERCRRVEVPISNAVSSPSLWNKSERWDLLLQALGDGFPLTWSEIPTCTSCQNTGGRCGYDGSSSVKTVCFFKDANLNQEDKSKRRGVVIGIALGCSCVPFMVALLILVYWKRVQQQLRSNKDEPTTKIDVASFVKTYQSTMLRSYTYKEIKKMSDSFKEKLGEGGYGSVYKGQLSDGRLVAVKVLDKSNNHETQDFINEVSTIGRIHHFHIIYLLGFCLEGSVQALVYEFMPNGSLGDMLQRNELSSSLGIEKMLEISIGIAQGIQYLHTGCESRILHLDIKPQNILLDQHMNPKISDFGLAKMYARNKSAVAAVTTGARGTIGYIAPEMFMRNIGNPSDRSDVYSFGMLLLEMVGETKRNGVADQWIDSKSSEKYFPGWVYDKLIDGFSTTNTTEQQVEELEVSLLRKMVMVGLWCIQMNPTFRPSMTKVVEMLNGDLEAIEMPPKPLFYSAPPPLQIMDTQNLTTSSTEVETTDSLPLRTDTR